MRALRSFISRAARDEVPGARQQLFKRSLFSSFGLDRIYRRRASAEMSRAVFPPFSGGNTRLCARTQRSAQLAQAKRRSAQCNSNSNSDSNSNSNNNDSNNDNKNNDIIIVIMI